MSFHVHYGDSCSINRCSFILGPFVVFLFGAMEFEMVVVLVKCTYLVCVFIECLVRVVPTDSV